MKVARNSTSGPLKFAGNCSKGAEATIAATAASSNVFSPPSLIVQVLKQRVSRRLRRKKRCAAAQWDLGFQNGEEVLPRFWQRRFYDFNVWSLKKRVEKLHYMHANPITRKLVHHPKDWPWSSWSFYATGKGILQIDPV